MPIPQARIPEAAVTSSNLPPPRLRKSRPQCSVFGLPQWAIELVT